MSFSAEIGGFAMTLEAIFNFIFTAKHGMYSLNIKTVFLVLGIELIDSLSDSSTSVETSTKSFHQRWVDLGPSRFSIKHPGPMGVKPSDIM